MSFCHPAATGPSLNLVVPATTWTSFGRGHVACLSDRRDRPTDGPTNALRFCSPPPSSSPPAKAASSLRATAKQQTWEYTAYDFNNTAVVSGTFIVRAEGPSISPEPGKPQLLKPDAEVGPQVGTGDLRGEWDVEGQSIFFDMNPGWADNNVFLVGHAGRQHAPGQLVALDAAGGPDRGAVHRPKDGLTDRRRNGRRRCARPATPGKPAFISRPSFRPSVLPSPRVFSEYKMT